MKYVYASCLLFLLCGTAALGQVQPRGVFLQKIDNANPAFPVVVDVDRANRVYVAKDIMQVTVTSQKDGFLYLFYRDADAKVIVLFPNQFQQNNRIQGGVPFVSGPKVGFQIRVCPPFGFEQLKAVVSKKPLPFIDGMGNTKDFAKFVIASGNDNNPYAPVDDNAGNALLRAMEGAEDVDWAEGEINIRTVEALGENIRPPQPLPFQSSQGPKMHLILAADVSSSDSVGSVVQSDTYNLRELLENNVAGDRLNIIDLQDKHKGKLLTKENILQEICNLNVNSDDTIFFFYSGHGAFDPKVAQNDGQYFALASYIQNRETEKPVFRYEILDTMKSKNVRLSILISDCCFNEAELPTHLRPPQLPQSRGEMKALKPLVEKLFFEAKGVVDITASEKGSYGFIYPKESRIENGVNKGSVFTWNLHKTLTTEMYASKDWKQIFELVRENTNKDYQQVFKQHIADGQVTQKELIPHGFTLP